MREKIIEALIHLFAIIENAKEDTEIVDSSKLIIRPFLKKTLKNEKLINKYILKFKKHLKFYKNQPSFKSISDSNEEIDSTSMIQIAEICNQLNDDLLLPERLVVFIQLMELIHSDKKVTPKEEEFASLVALNFNLPHEDVINLKNFVLHTDENRKNEKKLIIASSIQVKRDNINIHEGKYLYIPNLKGEIIFLYLKSIQSFIFKYNGEDGLFVEGNPIIVDKIHLLNTGAIIKGDKIRSIYESEITKQFTNDSIDKEIIISGDEISFTFKNSNNGIRPFSFSESSGRVIGIIGGSGTGKSTLMNILNGKIQPDSGKANINGFTLEESSSKGVIGYVPQDDMLFEELSVYENLYFNAKICFSDFSKEKIKSTIQKTLEDFELDDIHHLKVGNPLNKSISGGQRKRLNIALELMREPSILFVDEPTSGLSSVDSQMVMKLLKNLALKGKLVISIIHQPSSEVFKLLDKIWILDKGGYLIYNGNPIDALVYFKTIYTYVNATESECPRCGNIIPDQVLNIIESKKINEKGIKINERRVSPEKWYKQYKENIESQLEKIKYKKFLPPTHFKIPSSWEQFKLFSHRNFLSKISNRQYIVINCLEAPILSFILAYFSKFSSGKYESYVFSENLNLPVYIFMSIVVALFMGLTISAQEIFKDRQTLERESFLNLSRKSYVHSKIIYLFGLSALQSASFVLVGNFILEIQGMFFLYWIILFSTFCCGNMIGLNISSSFNSIINIYISIPFILIPQILLGGAMINFNELHPTFNNEKYVPWTGDIMVSRWGYEALIVGQFRYNDYEKRFYEINEEISTYSMQRSFIIPELLLINKELKTNTNNRPTQSFKILRNELENISSFYKVDKFQYLDSLSIHHYSLFVGEQLDQYLSEVKKKFSKLYTNSQNNRDSIFTYWLNSIGNKDFLLLKKSVHNQSIEDLVTNRKQFKMIKRGENQLIQQRDPIFMRPYSNRGRAHFHAPYKIVGELEIPTYYFNLLVIWMMILLLYVMLLQNTLLKAISYIEYISKVIKFFLKNNKLF